MATSPSGERITSSGVGGGPGGAPDSGGDALSLAWIAGAFRSAAGNRQTLGYTLATGAVFGSLMGYINSAQQVFVDVYGLGAWFPVVFGLAACALAGLLAHCSEQPSAPFAWRIAQGVEMGRPSTLLARAEKQDGVVHTTWVGGACVLVSEGVLHLDED